MPNRPGTLGAVASALGALGADINLVEIVEKRGEIEVEEFILDLPPTQTVEKLVAACDRLESVQVEWVRNYPRGGGIEYDIELHRRIAADPSRAGEILASAAPLVFRAQWSVLLDVSAAPQVTFGTPGAPDLDADHLRRFGPFDLLHRVALEPDWIPGADAHHAVVSPMADQRAVIVARRGEPPFFGSELARLAHVTGATATTDMFDQPQSTTDPQTGSSQTSGNPALRAQIPLIFASRCVSERVRAWPQAMRRREPVSGGRQHCGGGSHRHLCLGASATRPSRPRRPHAIVVVPLQVVVDQTPGDRSPQLRHGLGDRLAAVEAGHRMAD